jgi:5'-methylthioadenosine phosphorylase
MIIGIIGGSGLYDIDGLDVMEEIPLSTPYGSPSSIYKRGILNGVELVFLSRHGIPHSIPPHKVNYRANMWGFKSLGVEEIISIGAVGGINCEMQPGSIVILDQVIDMTMGARPATFYDGEKVVHVDFTLPYCTGLRDILIHAAGSAGLPVKERGTYICSNGPRLETAKEIQFFSLIGADVVGMTAMPEAALARELEMCCAGISVVTNYAAGLAGDRLTTTEVVETMKNSIDALKSLLRATVAQIPAQRSCTCKDALKDAEIK